MERNGRWAKVLSEARQSIPRYYGIFANGEAMLYVCGSAAAKLNPVRFDVPNGHDDVSKQKFVMTDRLISVVDDDESIRESLPDLLRQLGFAAKAFSSAEAFLASDLLNDTRCLILDVVMPGMSGPELHRELKQRQKHIPTIFITATGDRSVRSRLLADGGVECLFKPFSDTALLDALAAVFLKDK